MERPITAQELFALVNVGDSRTYLLRHGRLRRVTIDHSYVQELVATGHITDDEARTHPRRNIVTRALGIDPAVRVDVWTLPIVRGDRFLLCSDGLVDEVRDDDIVEVLRDVDDPQQAAEELVELANRRVVATTSPSSSSTCSTVPRRPTPTPSSTSSRVGRTAARPARGRSTIPTVSRPSSPTSPPSSAASRRRRRRRRPPSRLAEEVTAAPTPKRKRRVVGFVDRARRRWPC